MASISQCFIGCSGGYAGDSLGNGGRGIWVVAAGYSQKFTDTWSGELNVGHMEATELYEFDESIDRDEDMGTEVNATITAQVQKGLKISLTGGWANVGDFMRIDNADSGGSPTQSFKDAWTSYVRVNYAY
jgi:hypothetical protein